MHTSDADPYCIAAAGPWMGPGPGDRDPVPHDPDTYRGPPVDPDDGIWIDPEPTVPMWPRRRAVPVWDGGPTDDLDEDTNEEDTP